MSWFTNTFSKIVKPIATAITPIANNVLNVLPKTISKYAYAPIGSKLCPFLKQVNSNDIHSFIATGRPVKKYLETIRKLVNAFNSVANVAINIATLLAGVAATPAAGAIVKGIGTLATAVTKGSQDVGYYSTKLLFDILFKLVGVHVADWTAPTVSMAYKQLMGTLGC